jgi:hypothetical protein
MKRLCIMVITVVALWGLPSSGFTQAFFDAGKPTSLGGLPFPVPKSASCVNGAGSWLMNMPSLYVGWLEHGDGSSWALQRQASKGTATWPLKGFWFEATKEVALDTGPGLLVSGGVFVPSRSAGTWSSVPGSGAFAFDIPSYDWWFVDTLAKARVSGNFELLAGFRWDHTSTRVDYSDNTSDDYILNSYMPLIGTQVYQPFSNGSMLVRFVCSPLVFGKLKYHFWSRDGYAEFGDFPLNSKSSFLEVLADYRVRLTGDLHVGVFAKWNWLRVKTDERNLSGLTTESVSWGVDIRSWTLGGDVSLAFSCPI